MSTTSLGKKQIPIAEGIFSWPSDDPRLIASKCDNCGEVIFPTQEICPNCSQGMKKKILLSKRGTLDNYSAQFARPPHWSDPAKKPYVATEDFAPYGVGTVRMPEGLYIISVLTESDPAKLKVGMDVELVVEKLYEEGNEVMGFKFKPV